MRTVLMLHVLLCPLVFLPWTPEAFEFPKTLLLRLSGLALAAVLLARPGGGRLLRPAGDPAAWALYVWLVLGGVAAVLGLDFRTSLLGAHESYDGLSSAAAYVLLYVAARATLRTRAEIGRLIAAAAAATALACAYALVQAAGLDPLRWHGDLVFAKRWLRPFASFGHPNHLGAWLATMLPLLALPWMDPPARRASGLRAASLGLAGVAGAVLLATLSRAAWIGALVGLACATAVWWATWGRRAVRPALAAAAAALAIAAGTAGLAPELRSSIALRAASLREPEREPRWPIWQAAWRMARDHPLTGVGPDCFRLAYGGYRTALHTARESDRTPARAHAELLHVAATFGVPGLLAALALCGGCVANLRRARARARDPGDRVAAGLVASALAAFAASVSVGFHAVSTASWAAILLGALAGLAGRGSPASATEGPRPGRRAGVASGAALLLAIPAVALPLAGAFYEAGAERLARVGRLSAAQRAAERSVALAPLSPRGWAVLAHTRHQQARLASAAPDVRRRHLVAARRAVERAVALEPAASHHRMHRAQILTRMARMDPPLVEREEALASIDAAVALEPALRPFLRAALELSLQLGDTEGAERIDALRRERYGDAP